MVGSRETIPQAQLWSRVRWTTMSRGVLLLHDPERSAEFRPEKLSGSRWRLFFHDNSDSVMGKWTDEPFDVSKCDILFEHRVHLVNILTWQVGHLLIDVLEPLHYDGGDAQLILHVANEDEQKILEEKVRRTVYDEDTPFGLLRNFTNKPIMTKNQLMSLGDNICFADISLELDISLTYYSLGAVDNTQSSPLDNSALKTRYSAFKRFLNQKLLHKPSNGSREEKKRIVFVKRKGSRKLINIDDLMSIAAATTNKDNVEVSVVSLEEMTFTEQIDVFKRVDILVAQYGSAAHNVLFMRPGTVLLLLMQPDWCPYSWHYANQATLSDVKPICVCSMSSSRVASFRWTYRAWRQGPWISKDADFAVDPDLFRRSLDIALQETTMTASSVASIVDSGETPQIGEPFPPRVHISDARIERQLHDMAKVSLVAEVVGTPPSKQSPSLVLFGLEREWLDDNRVFLCVTADDTTCFSSSSFNEFSTIDLTVPWGSTVNLRCWLALDGQEMARSETYWTAVIDAESSGLGISTITHTPAFVGRQQREFVVDWRPFRHGESMEIPVVLDGRLVPFMARLDLRTELQRRLAEFCREARLDANCFELARAIDTVAMTRMKASRLGLPQVQDLPTVKRPFVFLHNEKTAGSTVRRDVVDAAKRIGAGFYVPCYDEDGVYREDQRCYGFDLSNTTENVSKLAVVAGHFEWKVWDSLPSSNSVSERACFTTIRHPVDRAISLYYERVYQRDDDIGGQLMNDLDPEYLRWLLREFKGSAFGKYRDEGMCDTMCKMFLDLNVHKGRSPSDLELDRVRNPERFDALYKPLNVTMAKSRLSHCVVGFQDDWPSTMRTLSTWFPWIAQSNGDGGPSRRRLNVGPSDAETRSTLHSSLRSEIEACNACDLALYEHAVEMKKNQDLVFASS